MNEHRAVLIPVPSQPGERAGQAPRLQVCRAAWGGTSWELQHFQEPWLLHPARHNTSLRLLCSTCFRAWITRCI